MCPNLDTLSFKMRCMLSCSVDSTHSHVLRNLTPQGHQDGRAWDPGWTGNSSHAWTDNYHNILNYSWRKIVITILLRSSIYVSFCLSIQLYDHTYYFTRISPRFEKCRAYVLQGLWYKKCKKCDASPLWNLFSNSLFKLMISDCEFSVSLQPFSRLFVIIILKINIINGFYGGPCAFQYDVISQVISSRFWSKCHIISN